MHMFVWVLKYVLESIETICFRLLCNVSLTISMSTTVFRAAFRFSIYYYNGDLIVVYYVRYYYYY